MDQGNGFCLRWEKFTDFYRGSFSDLVKSENFTDMSLYCEGELVKCHRVILSASSTYFQNLLLQLNQVNPVIVMRDVELIDLKCVLSFIYTGEVTVLQDQLRRVVKLGEDLKVKGLGEEEERTPPSSDRVVDEPVCTVSEPKRRKLTARNTEKPPSRILTSPSSNITENSLTQHLSRNVDHFGTIDQFGTAADTKAVTESAISVKSEIFFADDVNTNESLRKGASECEETLPDLEQSVLDAKIFRTLEQTNEHSGEGSSDAGVTTGWSDAVLVDPSSRNACSVVEMPLGFLEKRNRGGSRLASALLRSLTSRATDSSPVMRYSSGGHLIDSQPPKFSPGDDLGLDNRLWDEESIPSNSQYYRNPSSAALSALLGRSPRCFSRDIRPSLQALDEFLVADEGLAPRVEAAVRVARNNPSRLVKGLARALFSVEELQNSNCGGTCGKSPINRHKRDALIAYVKAMHTSEDGLNVVKWVNEVCRQAGITAKSCGDQSLASSELL